MPNPRSATLRRLFARSALPPWYHQRRWARVEHDVRFLATHNLQERVLERYRDKLGRKAKGEGLNDVDALKEAYRERIHALRKEAIITSPKAVPKSKGPQENSHGSSKIAAAAAAAVATAARRSATTGAAAPHQPPPPPPSPVESSTKRDLGGGIKTLSSFIDLERTLELPPKEIEYIWRLRHSNSPNSLCAIIPKGTYNHMAVTARKHPQFILPLPRKDQGAEIHFLQWTFPHRDTATVLFTHLAEYKLRGEYASPHTSISLHLELLAPKGLVLAQGHVQDQRGISVEEGKWLLMCLQKFYGVQSSERDQRQRLLEQFSNGDSSFQVQDLLDEAERIG